MAWKMKAFTTMDDKLLEHTLIERVVKKFNKWAAENEEKIAEIKNHTANYALQTRVKSENLPAEYDIKTPPKKQAILTVLYRTKE